MVPNIYCVVILLFCSCVLGQYNHGDVEKYVSGMIINFFSFYCEYIFTLNFM